MIRAILLILVAAIVLSGCIVRRTEVMRVPSADSGRPAAPAAPAAGEHTVSRGETLYSIAFRNGVDWRDVAAWNGLPAPYTIYPGQRLRLSGGGASAARHPVAAQTQPVPSDPPPAPTPPAAAPPLTSPPASQPSAAPPSRPVASTPAPATTTPAPPPATPPVSTPAPATTPPPAAAVTASAGGLQWRWPTQGEVIQRYSADAARQGIAIAGRSGQVIVAAADGEVVYSGSGLRGYGELVIVKHSPEFLSAYAHNRKRLVNEGERVRAGQPIAEMGRTGTDRDKLHFEIRRGGRPVDPMGFLPRR